MRSYQHVSSTKGQNRTTRLHHKTVDDAEFPRKTPNLGKNAGTNPINDANLQLFGPVCHRGHRPQEFIVCNIELSAVRLTGLFRSAVDDLNELSPQHDAVQATTNSQQRQFLTTYSGPLPQSH